MYNRNYENIKKEIQTQIQLYQIKGVVNFEQAGA